MAFVYAVTGVVRLWRSLLRFPAPTLHISRVSPTIEQLEPRCLPVSPGTLTGFVSGLYQTVLNRAPEPAGLQFWVGWLNAGASRIAVAQAFWNSDERYTHLVDDAYQIYLNRAPDLSGLATHLTALRSGLGGNGLIQAFVSSPEYQTLHPDNDYFMQALYTDLLGRTPDPAGLAAWKAALQQGLSRTAVVAGFIHSPEFATVEIQTQYETLLQRQGSPSEVASWLPLALQSRGQEAVAVSILASPEFFQSSPTNMTSPPVALFKDAAETVFQLADLRHAADPTNPAPPLRHFVANADEAHQDLLQGRYPVVAMSLDDVISLSQSNDPNASQVVFFGAVHRGFLQLMARPEINSIADLRGKTVAVDTTTGYAAGLFAILRENGLEPGRDVNIVFAGATNVRYEKLVAGQFDATLLGTPFTVLAKQQGFHSLARPIDLLGGYQGVVFATLRPWLATHAELARRLVNNFNSTVQWAELPSNRPAVVSLISQTLASQNAASAAPAVAEELFGPASEFNPAGQINAADVAVVIELYNASRGGALPADAFSRIYQPIGG